ncbi:MAG: helix-turn-helix domain-containing protein [Firmicutes bacterium]|nr:helix-turn-helix domain-containing protein [Bacillota bacterium]
MKNIDLHYVCTTVGNLAGIPVRLFRGGELSLYHSIIHLPKDPMLLYREQIFAVTSHVGYFVTPHFYYYGIVNSGKNKIIIGPTRQIVSGRQELHELAFLLDIPKAETEDFINGMSGIVKMPLDSIIQILCVLNHILNGERLGLEDISIYDTEPDIRKELASHSMKQYSAREYSSPFSQQISHNSLSIEQAVTNIIRTGDTATLKSWIATAPAVRAGIMAADQLRQAKNTFVVTATLASRAAIRGGMNPEDALSLSDAFIRKCELLSDMKRINTLQYHMILEYTEAVERIRRSAHDSPLAMQAANYIRSHLSETVTVEAIAKHLYLSRPYLSARFKAETGISLTDFILREKIEEAKRLLEVSDKSFTNISDYLGFSSQSHFSRVFKKYSGYTPKEYRNNRTALASSENALHENTLDVS